MFFNEPMVDTNELSQSRVDRSDEFSGGLPGDTRDGNVTFGQMFSQADKAALTGEQTSSGFIANEMAIDGINKRIKDEFGLDVENPHKVKGLVSREQARRGVSGSSFDFWKKRIEEIKRDNPNASWLNTTENDRSRGNRFAREQSERMNEMRGDYNHWTGPIAETLGGMWAMRRDPFNIATSTIGASSKAFLGVWGAISAAGKNAGVNMAVETAQQPFVQAYRDQAGLDSGLLSHGALNVLAAGAFGFGLDITARGAARGFNRGRGNVPLLDGDGRIGEWIRPDALKAAREGDIDALKMIASKLGLEADPTTRGYLQAMEIDQYVAKGIQARTPDGTGQRTLIQTLRSTFDRRQPPGRPADPATPDLGTMRNQLMAEADAGDAAARATLDTVPPESADLATWRKFADNAEREDLKAAARSHIANLEKIAGRETELEAKLRDKETSPADMARVFKENPAMKTRVDFADSNRLSAGVNMARLPDDVLADVDAGKYSPSHAALVGELVEDPTRHRGMLDALTAGDPKSAEDARAIIGDELQRDTELAEQYAIRGIPEGYDVELPGRIIDPFGKEADDQIAELAEAVGYGRTTRDIQNALGEAAGDVDGVKGNKINVDTIQGEETLIDLAKAADNVADITSDVVDALKRSGVISADEYRILSEAGDGAQNGALGVGQVNQLEHPKHKGLNFDVQPDGFVHLYRGQGAADMPSTGNRGRFFSTNRAEAEEFGDIRIAKVPPDRIGEINPRQVDGFDPNTTNFRIPRDLADAAQPDGETFHPRGVTRSLREADTDVIQSARDDMPAYASEFEDAMADAGMARELADDEVLTFAVRRELGDDIDAAIDFVGNERVATDPELAADVDNIIDMGAFLNEGAGTKAPETLVEFVRRSGGIRDAIKDLDGIKVDENLKPFVRKMSRDDGQLIDDMAATAHQAGFFDKRPSVAEFLDAIDEDVRFGNVVKATDQDAIYDMDIRDQVRTDLDQIGITEGMSANAARSQAVKAATGKRLYKKPASVSQKAVVDGEGREVGTSQAPEEKYIETSTGLKAIDAVDRDAAVAKLIRRRAKGESLGPIADEITDRANTFIGGYGEALRNRGFKDADDVRQGTVRDYQPRELDTEGDVWRQHFEIEMQQVQRERHMLEIVEACRI